MRQFTATLDRMGRLVVPAAFRRALGVQPGARLLLHLDDKGLHIQTASQALANAQQLVRRYVPEGHNLSDELVADRRREAKDE